MCLEALLQIPESQFNLPVDLFTGTWRNSYCTRRGSLWAMVCQCIGRGMRIFDFCPHRYSPHPQALVLRQRGNSKRQKTPTHTYNIPQTEFLYMYLCERATNSWAPLLKVLVDLCVQQLQRRSVIDIPAPVQDVRSLTTNQPTTGWLLCPPTDRILHARTIIARSLASPSDSGS